MELGASGAKQLGSEGSSVLLAGKSVGHGTRLETQPRGSLWMLDICTVGRVPLPSSLPAAYWELRALGSKPETSGSGLVRPCVPPSLPNFKPSAATSTIICLTFSLKLTHF